MWFTFGGVFETEVGNGAEEFGLEEEIAETGRVHSDVGTLLVLGLGRGGSVSFGGSGSGRRRRLERVLLVVCDVSRVSL